MNATRLLRHPLVIAGLALGGLGLLSLLPEGGSEGASFVLVRISLALTAIIALALAAIPILRRVPVGGRGMARRLQCLEQLSLDQRHRIALVSVDGRELLISLQSDGCRLLADLHGRAAADGQSEGLEALRGAIGQRRVS